MPDLDPKSENPYQAPAGAPPGHDSLSTHERATLEALLRQRDIAPTILNTIGRGRMLRAWLIVAIPMALFCLVASMLLEAATQRVVVAMIVGMFAGCVARDIGWIRRSVLLWPLHQRILDFDKIDALLAGRDV